LEENEMEIRHRKTIGKNGVKETGYVTLDAVQVNEIVVKKSDKGIFFEMPGQLYKDAEGNWKKNYHATPISKESAAKILELVKKAVDENKYRPLTSERDRMQLGFVNLTLDQVSVKVSITDDGRIITPYRSYEKDGEKKYVNYVNLTKEQADAIRTAFNN
jgi:DNA-binding cell septation regulator SpoVG